MHYTFPDPNLPRTMSPFIRHEDFQTILDFAFGIADRGIPLSLVMVEPDGWPDGDLSEAQREALDGLAAAIGDRTRRSDRVARPTDTRFVALLMDCNRQGALIFADRLQLAAGEFSARVGTTVSCGVASFGWGMKSPGDLVTSVEAALSRAHAAGGDRIEIHEGPQEE